MVTRRPIRHCSPVNRSRRSIARRVRSSQHNFIKENTVSLLKTARKLGPQSDVAFMFGLRGLLCIFFALVSIWTYSNYKGLKNRKWRNLFACGHCVNGTNFYRTYSLSAAQRFLDPDYAPNESTALGLRPDTSKNKHTINLLFLLATTVDSLYGFVFSHKKVFLGVRQ